MTSQAGGKKPSPKITTEIIRRYYVEIGEWIYGGPFDTKEEAKACLVIAKKDERAKAKVLKEAK
jgi:hypothetical protein